MTPTHHNWPRKYQLRLWRDGHWDAWRSFASAASRREFVQELREYFPVMELRVAPRFDRRSR